jgi:CRP/FNR family transcriptional regulator
MTTKKNNCFNNCKDCPAWKDSIFKDLDQPSLDTLSIHKTPNTYLKGQTLFMQGNPSFGLYCLGSGNVKVSIVNKEGKESIVRIASSGHIVGHRSIFAKQPYQAMGTSLSTTQACFIDQEYLLELVKTNVSVANYSLYRLAKDLGVSEKKISSLSHQNVRERLALLLLLLNDSHGVEEDGEILLKIDLSREEMASILGMASETLIRCISDFKDESLIRQEKKMLVILDIYNIRKIANDPALSD